MDERNGGGREEGVAELGGGKGIPSVRTDGVDGIVEVELRGEVVLSLGDVGEVGGGRGGEGGGGGVGGGGGHFADRGWL